jgi:hypothetical protein
MFDKIYRRKYEKKLFIGIAFSKIKFDVSVVERIDYSNAAQARYENSKTGYNDFLK